MKPRPLFLAGLVAVCSPLFSAAPIWRPITPEDRGATLAVTEASANGLTLLREVAVDCSDLERTVSEYYFRAKVFNSAGVDALNKTEIQFDRDTPIRALAARVVKPDGRIIPVAPSAIFTREVVKTEGVSVSVKAFSFAGLEPGDIAEYQYRTTSSELTLGLRFFLDDCFPTSLTRIRIGAVRYPGLRLEVLFPQTVGFTLTTPKDAKELVYEARDIPSTIIESFPPPEDQAKPWFLYYYTFLAGSDNDYWQQTSEGLQDFARTYCAPKAKLKGKAATLLAGASDEEAAIRRLYEFCRTEIKNLSYDGSGFTDEQIAKLKPNKSADDVLANGYGSAAEINLLFAALLRASGRECTPAYCSDRSQSFFNKAITIRASMPHLIVTREGSPRTYYDPGARFLAPGKLDWRHERATALIPSGKTYQFVETPQSPAAYTTTRRTARLRIAPDGTLEGDISWSMAGHAGFAAANRFAAKTTNERRMMVEEEIKERIPTAEISDCTVTLPEDMSAPPQIRCHIRVPDYATLVGDRLLLPFAFFQKGLAEPFAAASRKTNIYFPYLRTEIDTITFTLPDGYELETPKPFEDAGGGDLVHHSAQISFTDNDRTVIYERRFARNLFISPIESYGALREVHEKIRAQDDRVFSLRATTAPRDAATSSAALQ